MSIFDPNSNPPDSITLSTIIGVYNESTNVEFATRITNIVNLVRPSMLPQWGEITGTITNQTDLIDYLNVHYQPLSSNLTSWAALTRASGFDTFTTTPSSANLRALLTDETGTGFAVFSDTPTFTGNTILNSNVTYTPTINSSLTGANQRIPSHTTANMVFTNAGLTSIGSANDGGVSGGHTLCITNETGGNLVIVNNYGGASVGEAIYTGTGSDRTISNHGTFWLQYNATASAWVMINGGLVPLSALTGLGTGVAAMLATFSSANIASACTDETGSGALVFATSPTLVGGSHTAITNLAIRDTSAAFDVTLAGTSTTALTAGRTITWDVNNSSPTVQLGAWTDWSASINPQGFSSTSLVQSRYIKIGKTCILFFNITGVSNAITFTITLPFAAANNGSDTQIHPLVIADNGGGAMGEGFTTANSTTYTITNRIFNTANFTASGTKKGAAVITYQTV